MAIQNLQFSMSSLDLTSVEKDEFDGETTTDSGYSDGLSSSGGGTGKCGRILRNRRCSTASEERLHAINRRGIGRPQKHTSILDSGSLSKAQIEKIYLNKKVGRMKVTQLETIFEEDIAVFAGSENSIMSATVFGSRKQKRSLSCSDGVNVCKTLKDKRKRRVKTMLGVSSRFKRVSMKYFKERMNELHGDGDDSVANTNIEGDTSLRRFYLGRSQSESSMTFHTNIAILPDEEDEP